MNDNHHLFQSIKLTNLLSFGPDSEKIELRPLNVLIGPNASGKSNLIEAISLLKAAPHDLAEPMRRGGGSMEWLWKGNDKLTEAGLEVTTRYSSEDSLLHRLFFSDHGERRALSLNHETIEFERLRQIPGDEKYLYNDLTSDRKIRKYADRSTQRVDLGFDYLERNEIVPGQSVLSARNDPDSYPHLNFLNRLYKSIMLYREWNLGRNAKPRDLQPTDQPAEFLLEDASNLASVLNNLQQQSSFSQLLSESLRKFHDSFKDIKDEVVGGRIGLRLHEEGMTSSISASRLSDGTLRYLCLLAILCHPKPPHSLICIEEPEIGLHPDLIPTIADMLVEASRRTQIIVTTHSDILVDALSDTPESILVCEKEKGSTVMRRLSKNDLKHWLEKYSLGQLWTKGELGGNRW